MGLSSCHVLHICVQLLFSLQHYEGDDRIKMFIFDLVSSAIDGQEKDYRNHTGLFHSIILNFVLVTIRVSSELLCVHTIVLAGKCWKSVIVGMIILLIYVYAQVKIVTFLFTCYQY
jgi:hypothetical protein